MNQIDIKFNYIFPESNPEAAYNELGGVDIEEDAFIVAGSYENSDHSYLFYYSNSGEYEFSLGSGRASDSLSKTVSEFSKVWLSDLTKIKDEKIRSVAEIHNKNH